MSEPTAPPKPIQQRPWSRSKTKKSSRLVIAPPAVMHAKFWLTTQPIKSIHVTFPKRPCCLSSQQRTERTNTTPKSGKGHSTSARSGYSSTQCTLPRLANATVKPMPSNVKPKAKATANAKTTTRHKAKRHPSKVQESSAYSPVNTQIPIPWIPVPSSSSSWIEELCWLSVVLLCLPFARPRHRKIQKSETTGFTSVGCWLQTSDPFYDVMIVHIIIISSKVTYGWQDAYVVLKFFLANLVLGANLESPR